MKYVLLLLLVLLSSCMQYKEEIWLEKDMSGKIQIEMKIYQQWDNFTIPAFEIIRQDVASLPGLSLTQLEKLVDSDSLIHIQATVQFEKISQLQSLFLKEHLHPYLGDVSLTKNKKGHHVVRRMMEGKESPFFKEKEIIDNLTLAEKQTMDLGLPWTWIVHNPSEVLFRTKGFRQEPDSPMTYEVNFKKVASGGVKLRMVFENEDADLPMNVWVATFAFGIVMLAIFMGLLIGSKKKRPRIMPK